MEEVVAVHPILADLIAYDLPEERIRPSVFPPPTSSDVQDAAAVHLFWQAARLTLRDGAAPLRSLGRISIRPRTYQFVPLLMALRIDPVRLLIADDVGTGKTAEALLIARELLDRGEIRRMCVLCPPYLCEQWQKEMQEKFNIDAVVVRSGTVGQLERAKLSPTQSIYEYYPFQVASIDFIKSEHNKHLFLQHCPELVIVDEVHGASETSESNRSQQQRHQLLREVARDPNRHLILLTATPHSGIETAFRSILGLLRPEFRDWNIGDLDDRERQELARHFVQRTRKDIQQVWEGGVSHFPRRESVDYTYSLSAAYRQLFEQTYAFCREIVRAGERLDMRRQRVRYWGALALLRCVMSSPAAAVEALRKRQEQLRDGDEPTAVTVEEQDAFVPFVYDTVQEQNEDENPVPPIGAAERTLVEDEARQLRQLERAAQAIWQHSQDNKVVQCVRLVQSLLEESFQPIVWCRYVATAEYVGEQLREHLGGEVQVTVITGRLSDDERRLQIDEIDATRPRVLVATDCLSEGINLQDKFTAVIHYDLPWNPNRLEQREGRVDRFGQTAPVVKAIRYFSPDSPIDGVVIRVLLDKAREIYRALGTYVPVPEESDSVMEAVMKALFMRAQVDTGKQLSLDVDLADEQVQALHQRWERDAERERVNRTRFAQRALCPEEVKRELEACDAVLGDADAVRQFVLTACQRLGITCRELRRQSGVYEVTATTGHMPHALREAISVSARGGVWRIAFTSPTPEGAEYVGRNHRFVTSLARWLMEHALEQTGADGWISDERVVSRCGAIRTTMVERLTVLLLLRVRYLLQVPPNTQMLSEEVLVTGYEGLSPPAEGWISRDRALHLLLARPDANMGLSEKRELVEQALEPWQQWFSRSVSGRLKPAPQAQSEGEDRVHSAHFSVHDHTEKIVEMIQQRAQELEASHKRIRQAVSVRIRGLQVQPQLPPDLLGILVLQPVVQR